MSSVTAGKKGRGDGGGGEGGGGCLSKKGLKERESCSMRQCRGGEQGKGGSL